MATKINGLSPVPANGKMREGEVINSKIFAPICSARKVVCIGDLHGNLDKAQELWGQLQLYIGDEQLKKDTAVVFLGDLCDRGPNTCALLDWLIGLRESYPRIFFVAGNHDFGMAAFLGCVPEQPSDFQSTLTLEATRVQTATTREPRYATGFWDHDLAGGMHYTGRRWGGSPYYNAEATFESYGVQDFASYSVEVRDAFVAAVPDAHKKFLADMRWVAEVECCGEESGDPIKVTAEGPSGHTTTRAASRLRDLCCRG
jgi:hypothetical protein